MSMLRFGLTAALLVLLAGCSSTRFDTANVSPMALAPEPSKTVSSALKATEIGQFVDAKALAQMSEQERNEAASAQFYALQYGRTGAPRLWQGDRGDYGKISVGPPVKVNERYCRAFTHEVETKAGAFSKSGMACRLEGGAWEVTSLS